MPDALKMLLLAVVQGLTEFLPVSSSGHLVLAKELLGFKSLSGLGVELLLHAGTLLAVFAYYRAFIAKTLLGLFRREAEAWRFALAVLLSMIPAVLLGLAAEETLEALADRPRFVACALLLTGLLLLSTRFLCRDLHRPVTWRAALAMGIAQAFAMLPGISRSGSTLSVARFLGLDRDKAAAFSFLMVVPIILAGNALHLLKALGSSSESAFAGLTPGLAALGFLTAAAVGYASVAWMVRLLNRDRFWLFGPYCLVLGLAALVVLA